VSASTLSVRVQLENIDQASAGLTKLGQSATTVGQQLTTAGAQGSKFGEDIRRGIQPIQSIFLNAQSGLKQFSQETLQTQQSTFRLTGSLNEMGQSLPIVNNALTQSGSAMDNIVSNAGRFEQGLTSATAETSNFSGALGGIGNSLGQLATDADSAGNALSSISVDTTSIDSLTNSADQLTSSFDSMRPAAEGISSPISNMSTEFTTLTGAMNAAGTESEIFSGSLTSMNDSAVAAQGGLDSTNIMLDDYTTNAFTAGESSNSLSGSLGNLGKKALSLGGIMIGVLGSFSQLTAKQVALDRANFQAARAVETNRKSQVALDTVLKTATTNTDAISTALSNFRSAQQEVNEMQKQGVRTGEEYDQAQRKLTVSQTELSQAAAAGGVDMDKFTTAMNKSILALENVLVNLQNAQKASGDMSDQMLNTGFTIAAAAGGMISAMGDFGSASYKARQASEALSKHIGKLVAFVSGSAIIGGIGKFVAAIGGAATLGALGAAAGAVIIFMGAVVALNKAPYELIIGKISDLGQTIGAVFPGAVDAITSLGDAAGTSLDFLAGYTRATVKFFTGMEIQTDVTKKSFSELVELFLRDGTTGFQQINGAIAGFVDVTRAAGLSEKEIIELARKHNDVNNKLGDSIDWLTGKVGQGKDEYYQFGQELIRNGDGARFLRDEWKLLENGQVEVHESSRLARESLEDLTTQANAMIDPFNQSGKAQIKLNESQAILNTSVGEFIPIQASATAEISAGIGAFAEINQYIKLAGEHWFSLSGAMERSLIPVKKLSETHSSMGGVIVENSKIISNLDFSLENATKHLDDLNVIAAKNGFTFQKTAISFDATAEAGAGVASVSADIESASLNLASALEAENKQLNENIKSLSDLNIQQQKIDNAFVRGKVSAAEFVLGLKETEAAYQGQKKGLLEMIGLDKEWADSKAITVNQLKSIISQSYDVENAQRNIIDTLSDEVNQLGVNRAAWENLSDAQLANIKALLIQKQAYIESNNVLSNHSENFYKLVNAYQAGQVAAQDFVFGIREERAQTAGYRKELVDLHVSLLNQVGAYEDLGEESVLVTDRTKGVKEQVGQLVPSFAQLADMSGKTNEQIQELNAILAGSPSAMKAAGDAINSLANEFIGFFEFQGDEDELFGKFKISDKVPKEIRRIMDESTLEFAEGQARIQKVAAGLGPAINIAAAEALRSGNFTAFEGFGKRMSDMLASEFDNNIPDAMNNLSNLLNSMPTPEAGDNEGIAAFLKHVTDLNQELTNLQNPIGSVIQDLIDMQGAGSAVDAAIVTMEGGLVQASEQMRNLSTDISELPTVTLTDEVSGLSTTFANLGGTLIPIPGQVNNIVASFNPLNSQIQLAGASLIQFGNYVGDFFQKDLPAIISSHQITINPLAPMIETSIASLSQLTDHVTEFMSALSQMSTSPQGAISLVVDISPALNAINVLKNGIGSVKQTNVPAIAVNISPGISATSSLQRMINNLRQNNVPRLNVDISEGLNAVNRLQNAINSLRGRNVTNTVTTVNRTIFAQHGFTGVVRDRQSFTVGEAGPELVHIQPLTVPSSNQNKNIIPSSNSMKSSGITNNGNGNNNSNGEIALTIPVYIGNEKIEQVVKRVAGNRRERYFR
jgi:hypothetical protein